MTATALLEQGSHLLVERHSRLAHGFQVLGVIVVGGAQVDSVVCFGHFYGFLPLV